MSKINVIKKGTTLEDTVFEKSGISMEFTTEAIEGFKETLQKSRIETEGQLSKLEIQIERTKITELPVENKDMEDFKSFAFSSNQLKIAEERIANLLEEHPDFQEKYESLSEDEKRNMPNFIDFILHRIDLEADLEVNNSE